MPDIMIKRSYRLEVLGNLHPKIRADDWRSPIVIRLLGGGSYTDGSVTITVNCRRQAIEVNTDATNERNVELCWANLRSDYEKCKNTYQAPVLTEFAALGIACVVSADCSNAQITEVTQRGDKADFWLNDRQWLLEVSGQESGDLATLRDQKRDQLLANPFEKPGFVCVSNFQQRKSYFWYFEYGTEDHDES
jgi:hypothetical protein